MTSYNFFEHGLKIHQQGGLCCLRPSNDGHMIFFRRHSGSHNLETQKYLSCHLFWQLGFGIFIFLVTTDFCCQSVVFFWLFFLRFLRMLCECFATSLARQAFGKQFCEAFAFYGKHVEKPWFLLISFELH